MILKLTLPSLFLIKKDLVADKTQVTHPTTCLFLLNFFCFNFTHTHTLSILHISRDLKTNAKKLQKTAIYLKKIIKLKKSLKTKLVRIKKFHTHTLLSQTISSLTITRKIKPHHLKKTLKASSLKKYCPLIVFGPPKIVIMFSLKQQQAQKGQLFRVGSYMLPFPTRLDCPTPFKKRLRNNKPIR